MSECQTPLIDRLRSIPKDARLLYDHGAFETSSYPVGDLCFRAAEEIAALRTAHSRPAPRGVAEVMRLVDRLTSEVNGLHHTPNGNKDGAYARCETARGELEQTITALVHERDALRARVAELEQDAARYKFLRHCDAPRLHQLVEVDGFEKFDKTVDSAIAASKDNKNANI